MTTEAKTSSPPAKETPWRPTIWAVLGDKAGDNGQVETVARALERCGEFDCSRKYLHVKEPYVLAKPREEAAIYHLDLEKSEKLKAPWPDLIITIGRRLTMAALWVQQQSGGRAKIALLGKPSGRIENYDLVVVSGEIQAPPLPNILPIGLPLMRVDKEAINAAVQEWAPRLSDLPRPLIAIMIGGPTGPYMFDASVVDRILDLAEVVRGKWGGTAYVITSRRTPRPLVERLETKLPDAARLFTWGNDAAENPYRALLGLADGIVVTGDSISMMVEVARLGRPLAILPLPVSIIGRLDQYRREFTRRLFAPVASSGGVRPLVYGLYKLGLLSQTRDFEEFHRYLIGRGLAVWAGEPFPYCNGAATDDTQKVVDRIRDLMISRASQEAS